MKLRQIVIGNKLTALRSQMKALEEKRDALAERREAMKKREDEIAEALSEVTEETPEEDRKAAEDEVAAYEADEQALAGEENENTEETAKLREQIDALQSELDEMESRSREAAAATRSNNPTDTVRKDEMTMITRQFFGMTIQQRDAFFADAEVKKFMTVVRTAIAEKRDIAGKEYTIPTVVLDLIRERIEAYSKLLPVVNLQRVGGKARQTIMGVVPDAVWTEMCAKLNELDLSFAGVEVDGYKVGGIIYVCNALLEDNDVGLAEKVIEALGQAMGRAIDKAILYGTGTKMPLGIVTRLLQTSDPGTGAGMPWEDLSKTNVISIPAETAGLELYQQIVTASGVIDNDYANGEIFWAMNRKTRTALMATAMSVNAAGAIVSGQNNEMPVAGGRIITLGFIPDNVIIFGYGELYLMAERAGMQFARSEEYHFAEDETAFKGTARYDGLPVIANGFGVIGLGGATPSASDVTFAPDLAN